MAGPGGKEVGRISIRVVPNTSGFARELKSKLKAIEKSAKIEVKVDLDDSALDGMKQKIEQIKPVVKVEVDTDGIVRETRQARRAAQAGTGQINLTAGLNTSASIAKIKTQLKIIDQGIKGYSIKVPIELVGWTKILAILGLISAAALGSAHALNAVGGALAVTGGLLATLPAISLAAAAGIGALAVGFHGFGTALGAAGNPKEFAEELRHLTPAAQEAAKALATFKQPLSDIRKSVQEALFSGIAGELLKMKRLLPGVETLLRGSAVGMREMVRSWIQMATQKNSVKDLSVIGENVGKAWINAKTIMADFGAALRDIAVVGSGFLPRLATAISNMAEKFRNFIAEARATGELQSWIENAIDKMKQLGRIIGNVWNTFKSIADAMTPGEDFLDMIERITQKMQEFAESKAGQQAFRDIAKVMRLVLDTAIEVFGQLFRTIADFLEPAMPFIEALVEAIGTFLVGALKAISGPLKEFGAWLSEHKEVIVPFTVALLAMVTGFKALVTVSQGFQAVAAGIKAIQAAILLLSGPVGIIIALTAGLAALTFLIVDSFKDGGIGQMMVDALASVDEAFMSSKEIINQYRIVVENLVDDVVVGRGEIGNALRDTVGFFGGWAKKSTGFINDVRGILRNLVSNVTFGKGEIGSALRQSAGDWMRYPNSVREAAERARAILAGFIGSVNRLLNPSSFWGAAYASGGAIGDGLAAGMLSRVGAVGSASGALAAAAGSALPHSPAEVGPFSGRGWTPYRGRALADGFAEGILSGTPKVAQAALTMVRDVDLAMSQSLNGGLDLGSSIVDSIHDATPDAIKALDKIAGGARGIDAEWSALVKSDDFGDIGAHVADAIANGGITLTVDGKKLGKTVRKDNTTTARRG